MRTNIIINDELMNEALNLTDLKTKKAVVEEGLKLLVQLKKQQKIKSLRGKLRWEGNLEEMRSDK
jgi:Arc/MetJ family transcription regulator